MQRIRRLSLAALCFAGALAAAHLPGCAANRPTLEPLTPDEQKSLQALRKFDPKTGKIDDKGTLFMSLDQNLRTWRTLGAKNEVSDVEQRESLEDALTRQVYYNFDVVLNELEHGSDPEHHVIAAAALGFSRIPAPDEPGGDPAFPALHPRASRPLLDALESGNDQLTINALLSIGRIAAPETPRQVLVEMMVKHHNEDVRANAALALCSLAKPADAPLLLAPLIGALSDTNPKVRLHAIKALGKLEDKSAQGPLLDRLRRDDSALVQACAAAQLGKIGDLTAVKYLIDALQTDALLIHLECRKTLVKITGKSDLKTYQEWRDWWIDADINPDKNRRT